MLLSTFEQFVISESCFLNCEPQQTTATKKKWSVLSKRLHAHDWEPENEHADTWRQKWAMSSSARPKSVFLVWFWWLRLQWSLRTQSLFTDFHTATVAYYIASLSLPPPHRPNGVHTILDAILNLFWCWLLYSWYVFMWVWLSPSQWEHVTDLMKWRREKKRGPEIFVYIQPIYTYT